MAHVVGIWAEKTGAFVARFFSEVVASVVTTACVAGATTAYIHYTAISAPEIAAPPKAETADIATLLSPVADPGRAALHRRVAVDTTKKPSVLPPSAPEPSRRSRQGDREACRGSWPPRIWPPRIWPPSLSRSPRVMWPMSRASTPTRRPTWRQSRMAASTPDRAHSRPPTSGPATRCSGRRPRRSTIFGLIDAPQTRRPADLASASATRPADRRLLGMPVPDLLPSGEDVANRVKGWGAAVGSLIP